MSALQSQDTRAGSRASSIHRSFSAYAALRGVRDSALRATVKAVAFVLIARANASGEAWPGYDTIGRDAGVDRRTAISAVAALESAGFIEKVARRTEEGDDDTNLYRLRIGLPARPREESAAAQLVQVEACEPANDVQAPRADAGPCEPDADVQAPRAAAAQLVQVEAPRADAGPCEPDAGGVVIRGPYGSDPRSPKLLRDLSQKERGHAPVYVPSEGDPWTVLVAEHERTRHARYGFRGLKEPVSAERRAAVTACLIEAGDAGVALEPLVRGWFDLPGRDGYLREKRHPFRCLLADLDGLIAAAVSKVRQKARERERGELAAVAPRQAPSERPAQIGLREGAAGVLEALRQRT